MGTKDKKALLSQLRRLMTHIIKWLTQPLKRSSSWVRTIEHSRERIKTLQNDNPSLNMNYLRGNWNDTFTKAKRAAEKEMNRKSDVESLTEKQVFEDEYKLKDEND